MLSHRLGVFQINPTLFGSASTSVETSDGGLNGGPLVLLMEVVSVRYEVTSEFLIPSAPITGSTPLTSLIPLAWQKKTSGGRVSFVPAVFSDRIF